MSWKTDFVNAGNPVLEKYAALLASLLDDEVDGDAVLDRTSLHFTMLPDRITHCCTVNGPTGLLDALLILEETNGDQAT